MKSQIEDENIVPVETIADTSIISRSKTFSSKGLFKSSFIQKHISGNESFTADNLELVNKNEWQQKKYCQICFEKFTTIIRQHHCRMCGRSCCHNCSSKRAIS